MRSRAHRAMAKQVFDAVDHMKMVVRFGGDGLDDAAILVEHRRRPNGLAQNLLQRPAEQTGRTVVQQSPGRSAGEIPDKVDDLSFVTHGHEGHEAGHGPRLSGQQTPLVDVRSGTASHRYSTTGGR